MAKVDSHLAKANQCKAVPAPVAEDTLQATNVTTKLGFCENALDLSDSKNPTVKGWGCSAPELEATAAPTWTCRSTDLVATMATTRLGVCEKAIDLSDSKNPTVKGWGCSAPELEATAAPTWTCRSTDLDASNVTTKLGFCENAIDLSDSKNPTVKGWGCSAPELEATAAPTWTCRSTDLDATMATTRLGVCEKAIDLSDSKNPTVKGWGCSAPELEATAAPTWTCRSTELESTAAPTWTCRSNSLDASHMPTSAPANGSCSAPELEATAAPTWTCRSTELEASNVTTKLGFCENSIDLSDSRRPSITNPMGCVSSELEATAAPTWTCRSTELEASNVTTKLGFCENSVELSNTRQPSVTKPMGCRSTELEATSTPTWACLGSELEASNVTTKLGFCAPEEFVASAMPTPACPGRELSATTLPSAYCTRLG
ncbi:hypothetical protein ACTL6U_06800 [Rhodovibrionaceae bacterium A322]